MSNIPRRHEIKRSVEQETIPSNLVSVLTTECPTNQNIVDLIGGQTDTEDSSSSSNTQVYVRNDAFVLELHQLTRDELPDNPLPEVKTRKLLKKKKRGQPPTNQSGSGSLHSSSLSESSVAPPGPEEVPKEEYYDAHESYHALAENQASAAVAHVGLAENQASAAVAHVGLAQVISEHGNVPKVAVSAHASAAEQAENEAQEPPATITKPVAPPE